MKVLELFWHPTEQVDCSLYDLTYQDGKLKVVLKFDYIEDSKGKMSFLLSERTSKQELKFPVAGNGKGESSSLWNSEIPIHQHLNAFGKGIWDAYLLIEKGGKTEQIRIKDKLSESIDVPPYFIQSTNKSFIPYSTIKGNLSFKCEVSKANLKIENIILEENGTLKLNGFFLVPSWNVNKVTDVKKSLLFRSGKNSEKELPLENSIREDITAFYGQAGMNYDWTGFEIELDFQENNFGITNGKSTKLLMKIEHETSSITLPIVIPTTMIFNKNASIQTPEGIKKIFLNQDKKDDSLSVLVTRDEIQAEVDTIYSDNGEIILNGRLITTNEDKWQSLDHCNLVINKRDTKEEYEIKLNLNQFIFSHTFVIKEMLEKGLFTDGIWDLYIRVENNLYRLVTRLDGIPNKQKLITIPQQLAADQEGKLFVIKPYYTLHEEVAIWSRDYLATKSIDKVLIENGILTIAGKLNIQPPNADFPSVTKGHVTMKGLYGAKYVLPVTWTLEKTGKTKLEFNFTATVDLAAEGLLGSSDELLRDINFDLIACEIDLVDGIVPFTMNIDPAKVIVTFEDQLKQNPKYKNKVAQWGKLLYRVCNKLLPINRKTAIFQSFHGKSYSDSPKYIYEEILAEGLEMKSVWVLNNLKSDLPGNPIIVRPNSLKYYYYMAIGKFFVNNGNFPDFYQKREGTVHLQTWHGTPLKKLGFDIDPNSPSYAENTSPALIKRNERWDYLIGPNEYTSKILQRAFCFKKEMLDVGYPRNDIFYKGNLKTEADLIKKKLNIPTDKKVILYAPTWRDYDFHNGNQHKPYEFKFDLDTFKERFGDDHVLILRLHYRDASRIKIQGYENFVYNLSSYDDIQELYLISDVLITDYSSVMFDYANLDRPIIFFTYDLSRYGSQVRGFYFDFQKEAPGPIVLKDEQLFHSIENIERIQSVYTERYQNFKEKFCHWEDGNAAKRTIEAVFKKQ
ncbi:CDP-glycerol glycerophosphotransferase family protein [Neobacillus sp. CF12]|uniref:CDP-glycerol glycerophosphotransferase family protein n=1 Tax=Neobacillus sp. CF12 TaxID=3055864 RepID=UPI0025A03FA4|nr:CDP-glycerol glycerophosphotransferase family protein [Neobacillus sp. CF12]MDM5329818.1 CDP-glycerol glycerophosphotransferase family protein [Neobacillus sp. CF12]